MRGPAKSEIAQLELDDLKVEQMFKPNDTTTSKTVKIFSPFRLNAAHRKVLADGKLLNVVFPPVIFHIDTQSLYCCKG